jgi:pimeloyl-ACP methyl ester carboxylesterase
MPQAHGIYYCVSQSNRSPSGPPVVLIHGAGASHLFWPAELRRLSGHTVYTLDLPGHGKSVGIGQHSIEAYTGKVIDFLINMGIFQTILVGHSMGGAIALQAAYQYPNQVRAVGLIASGACFQIPADLVENISNTTMRPVAFEWFKRNLFLPSSNEELVLKTLEMIKAVRPGVLYGDWQASVQFDLRRVVSQIMLPVWIAAGSEDRIAPVSHANFLASHMKQALVQVFPGAGHMLVLEKARLIEAGLSEFLRAFKLTD